MVATYVCYLGTGSDFLTHPYYDSTDYFEDEELYETTCTTSSDADFSIFLPEVAIKQVLPTIKDCFKHNKKAKNQWLQPIKFNARSKLRR